MNDATTRARELWQEGRAWEDMIADLRAEGFSKIDCIRVTVELLRVPLGEAKALVHFAPPGPTSVSVTTPTKCSRRLRSPPGRRATPTGLNARRARVSWPSVSWPL